MRFAIASISRHDHEVATIVWWCSMNRVEYCIVQRASEVPPDAIAVGPVKWVEQVLGGPRTPDYYPAFLAPWLRRKVWREESWPYHNRCFIKPADRHKRFTGFVKRIGWKGKRKGPFWCSDVVEFVTEWRWYVSRGQVLDARYGSGIEAPVPQLDITWPKDYSGAVDFGLLSTGEIALIEAHDGGYSTGWYGPIGEGATYVRWLSECWEDLVRGKSVV